MLSEITVEPFIQTPQIDLYAIEVDQGPVASR